jgi:hypothetical protein
VSKVLANHRADGVFYDELIQRNILPASNMAEMRKADKIAAARKKVRKSYD